MAPRQHYLIATPPRHKAPVAATLLHGAPRRLLPRGNSPVAEREVPTPAAQLGQPRLKNDMPSSP